MGHHNKGLDKKHRLIAIISLLTTGKPDERNAKMKSAFRYAREHGYDATINRYQGYLNRKAGTILD